jgi:hypothetical protein
MKALAAILLFATSLAAAQQSAPSAPPALTGQVTGRVICGDTDAPGRFAGVQLIAEHPSTAPAIDPSIRRQFQSRPARRA